LDRENRFLDQKIMEEKMDRQRGQSCTGAGVRSLWWTIYRA